MPLRTKRDKPIEELTEKELRKRLAGAEAAVDSLPPPTASPEERAEALLGARKKTVQAPEIRAELERREARQRLAERETLVARGGIERGRELLTPATIERFQRISQGTGLKLDPKRLDSDERNMVVRLWPRLREDEGSAEDRTAFEALVEKAAGQEPGFFDARRKEIQMKRQLAELKEEGHTALLPRRARYEEPGSVTLPRVVFSQLQTAKSGHWSIADIGCLAVLLSCFEEKRTLVRDSAFEERDGEVVLSARGPVRKLVFEIRTNPHVSYAAASSGWIDLPASLERLAAHGWLDIREPARSRVEIRLGERARALLERG